MNDNDATTETPAERLEYLRGEIRAERISYDELHELQNLTEHIAPDDVELLEWAGVPEFVEHPDLPLPGDEYEGRTVIASGWYTDDIWGLMTLEPEAPHYKVRIVPLVKVNGLGEPLHSGEFEFFNIVPAAQFFDEEFGFWGGG